MILINHKRTSDVQKQRASEFLVEVSGINFPISKKSISKKEPTTTDDDNYHSDSDKENVSDDPDYLPPMKKSKIERQTKDFFKTIQKSQEVADVLDRYLSLYLFIVLCNVECFLIIFL